MSIFRHGPSVAELHAEAQRVLATKPKSMLLAELPNDAARAAQCRRWAIELLNQFFQGQAETITDVLLSREMRYRGMSAAARRIVGVRRWSTSGMARDLMADSEMFARWAVMYGTAARSTS